MITKRDKIRASDKTPKKKAIKLELPSVSPLVKKYHSRVSKVLAEQTMNKCLFSNDTLWASIQLREQEDEAEVQQDVHDVLQ